MRTLPLLIAVVLCSCDPTQKPSATSIPHDKYLHDDSYTAVMNGCTFQQRFSDVYVFKMNSVGYARQIFLGELFNHEVNFHSSDPAAIAAFTDLLGHGEYGWAKRSNGVTFHVLRKVSDTRDALYFRVFVPTDATNAAWLIGGIDPTWSIKSAAILRWSRSVATSARTKETPN